MCEENEVFDSCGSHCELNCNRPTPSSCRTKCGPPGCTCKVGFYRSETKDCVRKEECSISKGKKGKCYKRSAT